VSSWGNIDDDSTLDIWYTNDQKSMTLTTDDLNM
jgi:hypothetical protein